MYRWGLHITATIAMPLAVRTGFAFNFGNNISSKNPSQTYIVEY